MGERGKLGKRNWGEEPCGKNGLPTPGGEGGGISHAFSCYMNEMNINWKCFLLLTFKEVKNFCFISVLGIVYYENFLAAFKGLIL